MCNPTEPVIRPGQQIVHEPRGVFDFLWRARHHQGLGGLVNPEPSASLAFEAHNRHALPANY
jgi:hypothetical protein